ncbi:MAG: zinc ribbon domain-containing protein [Clostridia bacterium]|nr:zinc ribbon domain-containing protein [Clostridia bacterium]
MFCKYCGQKLDDDAKFCQSCGAKVEESSKTTQTDTFFDDNETSDKVQNNGEPTQVYVPYYPMKWFKFLIYFLLFASAIVNVMSGISQVTGMIYYDPFTETTAQAVYEVFPGLQVVDIIVGILSIALGVFAVVVRFALAKFKAIGPKLLTLFYAFSCIINIVYCLLVVLVVPELVGSLTSDTVTSIITSVIMIFANKTYFTKRQELFIN